MDSRGSRYSNINTTPSGLTRKASSNRKNESSAAMRSIFGGSDYDSYSKLNDNS